MKKRLSIALTAVALVGLGVVALSGCQQSPASASQGSDTASQNQSASTDPAGRRNGNFGAVANMTSTGFTLTSQNGQVQVSINGNTKVTKTADAKLGDLKAGDSIIARGQKQDDGSIAAFSIEVGTAGDLKGAGGGLPGLSGQLGPGGQRGPGQGNGNNGQPGGQPNGQSPRSPRAGIPGPQVSTVTGTIGAINGDTITVKSQSGSLSKTSVNSDAVVRRVTSGSPSDIQNGQTVTVNGDFNGDGSISAINIQLVPAGTSPGGRQTG